MKRPLRIFLSCQQDLGGAPHAVPAYRFWRKYFAHALAEAGHTLLEAPACDWARGLLPLPADEVARWRTQTWSTALAWLRAEHARQPIDLFLSYLYPAQIDPASIEEIKSLGIPCVNFFCDNVREFRALPAAFRPFDLHWVPEAKALPLYARAGLPALPAPMPCWVPPDLRTPPVNETRPVSFVGTRDELRARLFAAAFSSGLDAQLWGRGWLGADESAPASAAKPAGRTALNQIAFFKQHGFAGLFNKVAAKLSPPAALNFDFAPYAQAIAGEEEFWAITRDSRVCLGVNRYTSPRLRHFDTYSRLRDLEAPMVGACYLTEWTEGLDQLYILGEEIETYRDAAELVAKTQSLVADPARRARLRSAGQRRALADHTIARTLSRIADRLGLA